MESMQDYMKEIDAALKPLERGDLVEGLIIQVSEDSIIADIQYAQDGVVYEAELNKKAKQYREGEKLQLVVTGFSKDGTVILSEKKALRQFGQAALDAAKADNKPVQLLLKSIAKGGFRVDIGGIEGYLPFSLYQSQFLKEPEALLGTTAEALIEKHDERGYVFTRLPIEKQLTEKKKQAFFQAHTKGESVQGKVVHFNRGGVVVEIDGMRGFMPRSEVGYSRSTKAEDILNEGDVITVVIRELNAREDKILVSLKDLQQDPWSQLSDYVTIGDVFEVYPINDNGLYLFYELADGIQGALPKKELPPEMKQSEEPHVVEVLAIDEQKRRIDLAYYYEVEQYESDEEEEPVNLGSLFGDKLKNLKF